MDDMQQQIKVFDLSNMNKISVVVPLHEINEKYGYAETFELIQNDYLIFGRRKNSNSENAVIKTDAKGNILKIIPTAYVDNPFSGSYRAGQFKKANNKIILLKAFCDTIWTWKNNGLIPKYIIPFPEELTDPKDLESVRNNFQYKTYLETDHFLYVTFMLGNGEIAYFYEKDKNLGKLMNYREGGQYITPGIPLSDYFYLSDSITYGYMSQTSVEWEYANLKNVIDNTGSYKVPEEGKVVLRRELSMLQSAVEEGNGAIIRYRLE